MDDIDLVEVERRSFRAATDTGLWDIVIASVVSLLAIGPLLSDRLGDFWSSAVFLPVWAGVFWAIQVVGKRVVAPRVGTVRFGTYRKRRLRRLGVVGLVANLVALVLGVVAAVKGPSGGEWTYPAGLSLVMLVGLSLVAYYRDVPRYFLYGLLLAVGTLVGEVLFRRGQASHHGFPLVFGVAAVLIAAGGLLRLARVLRPPVASAESAARGSSDE